MVVARRSKHCDQVAGFCVCFVWADVNFDGTPQRGKPGGEAIDGYALHPATEHLRKRRLIGTTERSGLLLSKLAPLDALADGIDERTFHGQLSAFGRAETHIAENIAAAALRFNFLHDLAHTASSQDMATIP